MTQVAETAPATTDQLVDHTLRQIEAAWVIEEFDAIIAANWPAGPPEPPPAAGPGNAEPPHPRCPAPLRPRGWPSDPQVHPRLWGRQRAPPQPARDR